MDQRDPYDAIVHRPPKLPVASEILQRQEHESIFREQIPAPRASALTRPQVARDEVCVLDERGGHYRLGRDCPHGVLSNAETGTDQEAEYRAMHPIPPASGGILDSGTDFGRGTR